MNEITHACGYEHPSQYRMDDIKLSMGDNNLTLNLNEILGYEKEVIEMEGIAQMKACDHLGSPPSKDFLN